MLVVESGAAATALGKHRLQLFVDALGVQPLNQLRHRNLEDLADVEEGGHGDGGVRLHLLPVAGEESPMLERLKVAVVPKDGA